MQLSHQYYFPFIKTFRTVIREDFFCTHSAGAAMRQVCREEYSFQRKGRLSTKHDLLFDADVITSQKKLSAVTCPTGSEEASSREPDMNGYANHSKRGCLRSDYVVMCGQELFCSGFTYKGNALRAGYTRRHLVAHSCFLPISLLNSHGISIGSIIVCYD